MLRVATLLILLIIFLLLLTDRDVVEFVRSNYYILDITVFLLMLAVLTLIFLPITSLFVTSILIRIVILTIITGVIYTNSYKSLPELLGTHNGLVENSIPECPVDTLMDCCEGATAKDVLQLPNGNLCSCGSIICVTGSSQ